MGHAIDSEEFASMQVLRMRLITAGLASRAVNSKVSIGLYRH